jgi:iron complex transport system ATP-binding protein
LALLETRDLHYSYPHFPSFRLEDVSLSFGPASLTGLLGPNGSGKSTLLRLLAGLMRPGSGRVLLEGSDLAAMGESSRARRIAFVPQSFLPAFPFTAWELVLMGRHPHRGRFDPPGAEDRRIGEAALERCDALSFRDRYFGELSGGERQRVLLASALAQQPRILLLDEPAASLDLSHQVALFDRLGRLARRERLCVICALHDLDQAARSFPRVVLMRSGRVTAEGAPDRILTAGRVRELYGVPVRRVAVGKRKVHFVPLPGGGR